METWQQIEQFPSYAVSDLGRVKRIVDCARSGSKAGKLLVLQPVGRPGKKRYLVRLAAGPGGRPLVHQLVMAAFGPPRPSAAHIIAHENGDQLDNHPSNLIWKTYKENTADRVRHGTDMRGEQCKQHLLTEEQVAEVLLTTKVRGYATTLAAKFGVHRSTVSKVANGKNWLHLSRPG
jgi:hypothetical protein